MLGHDTENQRGMTLLEVTIVMTIFLIISTIVLSFFPKTVNDFYKIQATNFVTVEQVRVLDRIAQVLRGSANIVNAQPSILTTHAYFWPNDEKPSRVTYEYDAASKTVLVEWIPASGSAPSYTYNSADRKTAVLLRNIELTEDLFKYYDKNGGPGPFSLASYKNISKITISLHKKPTTSGNIQSTNLQTSVVLRNTKGIF